MGPVQPFRNPRRSVFLRSVAIPLSEHEEAAFAAIVARLGNPERRRLRRLTITLGAIVLLAFALLVLVAQWHWTIYVAFSATFVFGLGLGWACIARISLAR